MLNYLRKYNPKQFHKFLAKGKQSNSNKSVPLDSYFEHVKNLATCNVNSTMNNDNMESINIESAVFDELDIPITTEEIETAIKNLKLNKSSAEDCMINEIFIHCKHVLLPCLHSLFNSVFETGYFPESWSKACIVPVFKKGDKSDPNNYRGISVISCLGKLYTSVLNKRLLNWDKNNDIITDAQFGFKPGVGTADAICALQTIISRTLKNKKKLYCCFVDYKKAFDLIDNLLMVKTYKTRHSR